MSEVKEAFYTINSMMNDIKFDEDKLTGWLHLQSIIQNHTVANTMLLYSQMQDATRILSKEEWKKKGILVKEKAKPLKMLIKEPGQQKDDMWKLVDVYDVSQTEQGYDFSSSKTVPYKMMAAAIDNYKTCPYVITDDTGTLVRYSAEDKCIYVNPENKQSHRGFINSLCYAAVCSRIDGEENSKTITAIAELTTWMMDERYCPQSDSGFRKKTPDISGLYKGDSFKTREFLELARTELVNLHDEVYKVVVKISSKEKERNQEEELEL